MRHLLEQGWSSTKNSSTPRILTDYRMPVIWEPDPIRHPPKKKKNGSVRGLNGMQTALVVSDIVPTLFSGTFFEEISPVCSL